MKKVIFWILTIICLVFVQTCTKALFKTKRMEEQKKEWRKISSSNTDERALSRMKKTSDIDRKLVIMAEEMNKNLPLGETEEEIEEIDVYTLTDENGNESQFELIGEATIEGVTYYALTELDENNNQISEEYVILRLEMEDGEEMLVSIDDDEEFDRVADFFDDQFSDIDYDA